MNTDYISKLFEVPHYDTRHLKRPEIQRLKLCVSKDKSHSRWLMIDDWFDRVTSISRHILIMMKVRYLTRFYQILISAVYKLLCISNSPNINFYRLARSCLLWYISFYAISDQKYFVLVQETIVQVKKSQG